jgi:hypothetical protein
MLFDNNLPHRTVCMRINAQRANLIQIECASIHFTHFVLLNHWAGFAFYSCGAIFYCRILSSKLLKFHLYILVKKSYN